MDNDIKALTDAMPTLPARSQEFARSLLAQAADRGLSEKQMFWVRKLVADASKPKENTSVNLGDFSGVIALFKNASERLKHPKVRLQLADGSPVALSVAGTNARFPGTVNVTDGKPFGSAIWYGRVDTSGKWDISGKVDMATATALTALLANFAANPAKVASAYGKATGSCCFCARELTDARSVAVGYGPICADKFALPWG